MEDSEITDNFVIEQATPQYDAAVEEGYIISQDRETGTYESGRTITVVVSLGVKMVTVPDVTSKTQEIALLELKQSDLKTEVVTEFSSDVEPGHVIRTSPEFGASVASGSTVRVYVSVESNETKMVKVPDVEGDTQASASRELENAGLVVIIMETSSDDVEAGKVISQSIEGLSEVESGTEITLYVSTGPSEE